MFESLKWVANSSKNANHGAKNATFFQRRGALRVPWLDVSKQAIKSHLQKVRQKARSDAEMPDVPAAPDDLMTKKAALHQERPPKRAKLS